MITSSDGIAKYEMTKLFIPRDKNDRFTVTSGVTKLLTPGKKCSYKVTIYGGGIINI